MTLHLLDCDPREGKSVRFDELAEALYGKDFSSERGGEDYSDSLRLFVVQDGQGVVMARAAAMVNRNMRYLNTVPGLVSFFESRDNSDAAGMILQGVEKYLINQGGVRYILGPLNGSTWERYRVTLPFLGVHRFVMDNINPDYYHRLFESNGYGAVAHYITSKIALTPRSFYRQERASELFSRRKITVDKLNPSYLQNDLQAIFEISLDSFQNNFLYTPIAQDRFMKKYSGLFHQINPDFVLIARDAQSVPVGFVFAFENTLVRENKELVVKTLAIRRRQDTMGLGSLLVETLHKKAYEAGYTTVYHALMHSDNISTKVAGHDSSVCREYRLYGKELGV